MIIFLLIILTILFIMYTLFTVQRVKKEDTKLYEQDLISSHAVKEDRSREFQEIEKKIMEIINSLTEKLFEISSDKATKNHFEVMRSLSFVQLGDDEEKIRSLLLIGNFGKHEDTVFLEKVATDSKQSTQVRHAAQTAKEIIQKKVSIISKLK